MPATKASSSTKPRSKASSKPESKKSVSKAPESGSKKRVRVVDPDEKDNSDEEESDENEEDKEEKAPSKAVKGKKGKMDDAPTTKSRKDLKDKTLDEIVPVVSSEVPPPSKGALKKSPTKAEPLASPESEEEEEEEIDFLKGFESGDEDEADSSDEEEEVEVPFTKESLPSVKNEKSGVQKKLQAKSEKKKATKTGTIYLGRIPHGFHEEEMRSYFSQFGEVTRLRLSRNKKTGASKHYAFIEFAYSNVAEIVQETMDNYLLAGHILVCKIVPDDEIHPKMWVGANRKFRPVPKARVDRQRREAPKTDAQKETLRQKLLRRDQAKREQLKALGIDYDFSGYAKKALVDSTKVPVKISSKSKKAPGASEPAKKKAKKSV